MNVGIEYLEIYFPKYYGDQAELEQHDKVGQGKYTIGLGQKSMSFAMEYEDVNSMSLTGIFILIIVVKNLLEKYNIDPKSIGRLEVGTETLIDKSKSTKTTLMRLFEQSNIEGVTTINACYGGTQALFNTVSWMQSEAWDGRLGIVVCADVAVYAKGPARPTGGAGAVAMLITPNARFVLEKSRWTFIQDRYDFYKPQMNSEYPTVDGQQSVNSYLSAIDACYKGLNQKTWDYICFHSPYNKMVQKAFLRFMMHEHQISETEYNNNQAQLFKRFKSEWESKTQPGCLLPQQLGNIYTGSLYSALISVIENEQDLIGKRIAMFSYGSGCAASLFVLRVEKSTTQIKLKQDIRNRLSQRIKIPCEFYEQHLLHKEVNYNKIYQFSVDKQYLFDGTYYLESIDDKYRRTYKRHVLLITPNKLSSNRLQQLHSQMTTEYNQLWNGFYKKTLPQRLDQLRTIQNLDVEAFKDGGLSLQNADLMIENCIGKISLPIGLGLGFLIDGQFYSVPMAIEEPSVIAGASAAAKLVQTCGGFKTNSTRPVMIGQIQVLDIDNYDRLECLIDANKQALIAYANEACQSMVKRGGGVEDIKIRRLSEGQASVDVMINVCDSMGANLVNTVVEHLSPYLEQLIQCRIGIRILSNLCTSRKVTVRCALPINKLSYKGLTGSEVAQRLVETYRFAAMDPYRAVTHNKGIINGIEALCNATGQDTRAVSASLHGYASITGSYRPLSTYSIENDHLICTLTAPISLGSQGGAIPQNSLYQTSLQILNQPNSQRLAEIALSLGLASNIAAMRALCVEGIQKGHMTLHARNIAIGAGIPEHLVPNAVQFMKNRKINKETAEQFSKAYTVYQKMKVNQEPINHALCTFSGEFQLEGSSDSVDLHVVFDCHSSQSIHLTFSTIQNTTNLLFGQKELVWLKNLFSVLEKVRLDQEYTSIPTKTLSVKLKLIAILTNLLAYNMIQQNFNQARDYLLHKDIQRVDEPFRYGFALLNELIRIFQYNVEQSIGDQVLRQALIQELHIIIDSHFQCFEMWNNLQNTSINRFWEQRKKRLSCTMMLLCDAMNLKEFDSQMLQMIRQLGDVYEWEITLARDKSKWTQSLSDPNVYTYWLHSRKSQHSENLLYQFTQESERIIEQKRALLLPQMPNEMKHLSYRATQAVRQYYKAL